MKNFDLKKDGLSSLNEALQAPHKHDNQIDWQVTNPREVMLLLLAWMPLSTCRLKDRLVIIAEA